MNQVDCKLVNEMQRAVSAPPAFGSTGSKVRANKLLTRLVTPADGTKENPAFSMTLTAAQGAKLTVATQNLLVRFLKDDAGATAIEFGLMTAGISAGIIAVVNGLGSKLNGKFDSISTQLQ